MGTLCIPASTTSGFPPPFPPPPPRRPAPSPGPCGERRAAPGHQTPPPAAAPKAGALTPRGRRREKAAYELETLQVEKENLAVEVAFMKEKERRGKSEAKQMLDTMEEMKSQLYEAKSDAADILEHKQMEIMKKDATIAMIEERFNEAQSLLEERDDIIDELEHEANSNSKALEDAKSLRSASEKMETVMQQQETLIKKQEEELEKMRVIVEEMQTKVKELQHENEDLRLKSSSVTAMRVLYREPWMVSKSRFRLLGEVPHDRDDNTVNCAMGKMLILNGGTSRQPEAAGQTGYVCNIETKKWEQLADMEMPAGERAGHGARMVGRGKLVAFGGRRGQLLNTVDVLNTESMRWMPDVRTKGSCPAREFHSTASYLEHFYVFGGLADSLKNDLHMLNFDTMEWSATQAYGSLPTPRRGASLCVSEDGRKLYLVGGFDGTKTLIDIYIFEKERGTWTSSTSSGNVSPPPREGHAATIVSNYLIISGGSVVTGSSVRRLSDTWVLDLEMMEWECLDQGGGSQEMLWLKQRASYSVFHGSRLLTLKPNREERLTELEVLEFTMPQEIEGLATTRRKRGDDSTDKLEILDDASSTPNAIEVSWRPPVKNLDRIERYKLMMATNTGVVKEVCQGKYTRYRVTGLRTNTQYIFCVKAIYDDGSFFWSDSRAFSTK